MGFARLAARNDARQIEQAAKLGGQPGNVERHAGALPGAGQTVDGVDQARVPGFEIGGIEGESRERLVGIDGPLDLGRGRRTVPEGPAAGHLHLQDPRFRVNNSQACS